MFARWMSLGCVTASMLTFAMASQAQAEACAADGTCPEGFMCQSAGVSDCPPVAACAPDDAKCMAAQAEPCTQKEIKACVPADCKADTDCSDGMVCYSQDIQTCSGDSATACAEGQKCPTPEPPTCTTETKRSCAPKYVLPCKAAADCGEGFTCDDVQECACSGSSGSGTGGSTGSSTGTPGAGSSTPGADAGTKGAGDKFAAPLPPVDGGASEAVDGGALPDPQCSCTSTGMKQCVAKDITCTTATDCPTSWTCESISKSTAVGSCAVTEPARMSDGGVPEAFDAGATGCTVTTQDPVPTENRCVPPYADTFGRGGDAKGGTANSLGQEDGSGTPTSGGDHNSAVDASTGGGSDKKGLCSVSNVESSSHGAGFLAVLGLCGVALVTRRRSRRAR